VQETLSMNEQPSGLSVASPRRISFRRRVVKLGLFLVWNAIIVFLLLELVCRFGLIKNPAHERSQKIRAAAGSFKVMVLGDSFSLEREGTVCQLLASDLRQRGFGVLNMGVEGTGPINYLQNLETYGRDYHPNLILVNYYVGNDLTDTLFGEARRSGWKESVKRVIKWSYLGELVMQVRAQYAQRVRLAPVVQSIHDSRGSLPDTLNPFLVELARFYPDYLITNLLMENDDAKRAWALNETVLGQMKQAASKSGARLVIAVFPSTLQVNESHVPFYTNIGFRYDAHIADSRKPQETIASWCERESVLCLDLLPAFRSAQPHEYYLTNDDHWNDDGNRLAYQVLSERTKAEKVWPEMRAAATSRSGP